MLRVEGQVLPKSAPSGQGQSRESHRIHAGKRCGVCITRGATYRLCWDRLNGKRKPQDLQTSMLLLLYSVNTIFVLPERPPLGGCMLLCGLIQQKKPPFLQQPMGALEIYVQVTNASFLTDARKNLTKLNSTNSIYRHSSSMVLVCAP